MTNGEFASQTVNALRLLNKDSHISRRYIISIAKGFAIELITQKMSDKSIQGDSIYKTIPCVEMVSDDLIKCDILEFRSCRSLMKSKQKLPETISGRYGSSVSMVTNVDGSIVYNKTTPRDIQLLSKRQFGSLASGNTYYISNGYLYLPNSTNELVNITLIPKDEADAMSISSCSDASSSGGGCKSYWDYEFTCMDRLIGTVINMTASHIAGLFARSIVDENPNMDSNQKSQITV